MMKKFIFVFLCFICAVSCSKKVQDNKNISLLNRPDWISKCSDRNEIVCSGIAPYIKNETMSVQIKRAENDGYKRITNKLKHNANIIFKTTNELKTIDIENLKKTLNKEINKIISEIPISVAVRKDIYQDKNNDIYVNMLLSKKNLDYYLNDKIIYINKKIDESKIKTEEKEQIKNIFFGVFKGLLKNEKIENEKN